jgi:hypothetical protein
MYAEWVVELNQSNFRTRTELLTAVQKMPSCGKSKTYDKEMIDYVYHQVRKYTTARMILDGVWYYVKIQLLTTNDNFIASRFDEYVAKRLLTSKIEGS